VTEEQRAGLVVAHFEELKAKYLGVTLVPPPDGSLAYVVKGPLWFTANYAGGPEKIECEYHVEIMLPPGYPDSHPVVREIGGAIENSFHVNPDGTLCLGAPFAVRKKFTDHPTLIGFVEECVVPFLYSYEHKKKYGKLPFGELSHGSQGILEHYLDLFEVKSCMAALGLVRVIADIDYRGHRECPCGSGQKLRNCHGKQLQEIMRYQSNNEFLMDYVMLLGAILKNGQRVSRMSLSKAVAKIVDLSEFEKRGFLA
jgi:hypothetical protein